MTPELEAEGWARDAIRRIANARRDADLHVSDRITLTLAAAPARAEALERHRELIAAETLAAGLSVVVDPAAVADAVIVTLEAVKA